MQATRSAAEGFVQILKALPRAQKDAVIAQIAQDKEFAHDILDLATIAIRQSEPSRSFRDYLSDRAKRHGC